MKLNNGILTILLTLSLAFFIYSCTLPAYMEMAGPDYDCNDFPMYYREISGFWCLTWGGILMPVFLCGFYDPHFNWALIWFANVFYVIAISRLYLRKRIFLTIIYALAAIPISTLFSFLSPCYPYKDFYGQVAYLESGYFYWVLSIAIVFAIATWHGLQELSLKNEGTKMFSLLCFSTLCLVLTLGICYTKVFWDKTNDMDFDNDRQCFVARNYLNRIVIHDAITEKNDTLFRDYDIHRKKEISVDEMGTYWGLSDNPFEKNHYYIITNISYPDKKFENIRIRINKDGYAKIASTE